MSNSDIILMAIGRLLSSSTKASSSLKQRFADHVMDLSLSMTQKSPPEDICFAAAIQDFAKIITQLS
jgi:hypothetical protein